MRFTLSLILIAALSSFSIQASEAQLKMLPTMSVINEEATAQERMQIIEFVKSEKVQKQLINLGVDSAEALNRVASLSDIEIKELSKQIKNAEAGGDFGAGGIIGVMVFIFIVLLITDILGFTKVFPFTRSIR